MKTPTEKRLKERMLQLHKLELRAAFLGFNSIEEAIAYLEARMFLHGK